MRKAVIFTGLVRNAPKFISCLEALRSEQDLRHLPIVFSTWDGEIARYPGLAEKLLSLGVQVATQPSPDLVLPGNVLHQMMAIDLALSVIGPGVFACKSRPDFANVDVIRRFATTEPSRVDPTRLRLPGQVWKFSVPAFIGCQPLYINDINFFGVSDDLKLLTTWSLCSSHRYRRVAPEQMIWGGVIIPSVSAFDSYFRSHVGLVFDAPETSAKVRAAMAASDLYALALATYAELLDNAYALFADEALESVDQMSQRTLDSLFWDELPMSGFRNIAAAQVNTFQTMLPFQLALDNCLVPSELQARFSTAWASLRGRPNLPQFADRSALEDALRFGQATERFGIPGHRAPIWLEQGDVQMVENAPTWELQNSKSSYVAHLEEMVNILKRSNEAMAAKLRHDNLSDLAGQKPAA